MAKIVCVLYDDPVDGYPPAYARDDIPKIEKYPDGQTTPTPSAIDFSPAERATERGRTLGFAIASMWPEYAAPGGSGAPPGPWRGRRRRASRSS